MPTVSLCVISFDDKLNTVEMFVGCGPAACVQLLETQLTGLLQLFITFKDTFLLCKDLFIIVNKDLTLCKKTVAHQV